MDLQTGDLVIVRSRGDQEAIFYGFTTWEPRRAIVELREGVAFPEVEDLVISSCAREWHAILADKLVHSQAPTREGAR